MLAEGRTVAGMVPRIGKGRRAHLYIEEWMEHRGLSDAGLASRMDTDRTTVWRWRTEQNRLNPQKIAALAEALQIEPEDFWRPPSRPSLDAVMKDASDEVNGMALDIITRLVKRG